MSQIPIHCHCELPGCGKPQSQEKADSVQEVSKPIKGFRASYRVDQVNASSVGMATVIKQTSIGEEPVLIETIRLEALKRAEEVTIPEGAKELRQTANVPANEAINIVIASPKLLGYFKPGRVYTVTIGEY